MRWHGSAPVSELSHCSMLDAHLSMAGSESELELQPRRRPPWTILARVAQSQPLQPLHLQLHHCRPRRLTFPNSAAAAVNSLGRQEKCNPGILPRIRPHLVPSRLHLSLHSKLVPNQFSSGNSRRSGLKSKLPRESRVLPERSTVAHICCVACGWRQSGPLPSKMAPR